MSQWTHVAGIVRVDALRFGPKGSVANPDLNKIIGPACRFDDWVADTTIPCGSEGSLEYQVIEAANESSLAAYTVCIWGDLRDYSDADAIEAWLRRVFEGLIIRAASVLIEVEYGERRQIINTGDGFTAIALAKDPTP